MISDHELAARIAADTSSALRELQSTIGIRSDAEGIAALKDAGDALAHLIITTALGAARPDDVVMSEEGDWQDLSRLGAPRLWIVDPLDATREFGIGVPDWAVQIALLENGKLTAAAVDLGAREVAWSSLDEPMTAPRLHVDGTMTVVVSRSRAPENLDVVLTNMVKKLKDVGVERYEVTRVGGVGGKVDELLQGRAQFYIGPTWCYEWDAAAPAMIAKMHGHRATDYQGMELVWNKANAQVDGLLMGPEALVDAFVEVTAS